MTRSTTVPGAACPGCLSTEASVYRTGVTDLLHGFAGKWDLLECGNCGLIYLAPTIPESRMGDYYPENYAAYSAGELSASPLVRIVKSLLILPYTMRFGQPGYFPTPFGNGRLLDVGCGAGIHVRQMSQLGWICTGVDMSPHALESARRLNPAAEFHMGLAGDLAPGEAFDLISMHHVLEHLHHPRQALADCYQRLRPGGRLVVNVPNIGSFEARCFGRQWNGLDAPRHLLHFRENVLERFLQEAGFEIEAKRPGMFATSVSESLTMCLPAGLRRRLRRSRLEHLLYQALLPFTAISYLLGNRSTLEVVAVKPLGDSAANSAVDIWD